MRAMTQDDLDAVTELDEDLYPGQEWNRWQFEEELAEPDGRRWLVTERAGQVTGYAGLSVDRSAGVATVINMAVASGEQGPGIGSYLLRELLAEASRAGAKTVELRVPEGRDHARLRQYYPTAASRLARTEADSYEPGTGAVVLTADLSWR